MPRDSDFPVDATRRALLSSGVATAAGLTVGLAGSSAERGGGTTQEDREFTADLAPEKAVQGEDGYVPYDDPEARGTATLHLNQQERELSWTVELQNMRCVEGVHVHEGGPEENGPHIAELTNSDEPSGEVDGLFAEGTFGEGDTCTDEKQNCLPDGVTFDELVDAMRAGEAYVQVHAVDKQVIRGQIE